jgi:predicted enzyme related to lactoylglutathione lyase
MWLVAIRAGIGVANLMATLHQGLGGSVRERTENPYGPMAQCSDDQGAIFSLWQPAPGFG